MKNIICLWSGEIVDIPAGWALCDGNNGTPNLRDRFVIGAGTTYNPNDSGGSVDHTHEFTGDGHQHDIPHTHLCPGAGGGFCLDGDIVASGAATGTTDVNGVIQPYYALAYIMKL